MPNKLAHFAIEAEDVNRARVFYETVFGWRFEPWGPPEFYLIHGAGVHGALQKRPAPVEDGKKGFECSIAVDDLVASMDAVSQAGGTVTSDPFEIPTVGTLAQFRDSEGNQAILIQYTPERRQEMGL